MTIGAPGAGPGCRSRGIGGYAVSVDRGAGSVPCAGPDRWVALAETDPAAAGGDRISPRSRCQRESTSSAPSPFRARGSGRWSQERDRPRRRDPCPRRPCEKRRGAGRTARGSSDGKRDGCSLSGMATACSGPFTAIAIDGGATGRSGTHRGDRHRRGVSPPRLLLCPRRRFWQRGRWLASTAAVRIDESPPQVAFVAFLDPVEPERMEATVIDRLFPGPTRRADRSPYDAAHFRASPSRRCRPRSPGDSWSPAGTPTPSQPRFYEFRATGYDAAGNATSFRTPRRQTAPA